MLLDEYTFTSETLVNKKHKCLINKSLQTLGYVRKITYLSATKP